MKITGLTTLFFLVLFENFAQQDVKLNVLVPPAPEVSALGKFGLVPVDYFTGVPNISLPIYTIEEGDITFPISIKYHSSGLKVKEDASEIGLGWALSASGTIVSVTRGRSDFVAGGFRHVYNDIPDAPENQIRSPRMSFLNTYYSWGEEDRLIEFFAAENTCFEFQNMVSGFTLQNHGVTKEYANSAYFSFGNDPFNGEGPDFASDLYIITIGDRTYKFVFDNSFKPVVLGDGALKIEFINDTGIYPDWKITDEEGIEYYFTERQLFYNDDDAINESNPWFAGQELNTWHLTKIKSPLYGEIIFTYLHESQTFIKPLPALSETYLVGAVTPYTQQYTDRVSASYSLYEKVSLDNIQFTLGNIKFLYEDGRLDLSGAKRLSAIEVRDNSNGVIKKFEFENDGYFLSSGSSTGNQEFGYARDRIEQAYPQFNDNVTKRLKLNAVTETGAIASEGKKRHIFFYNENRLPEKLSTAVDHWGYYNGASNPQLVPPASIQFNGQTISYTGGNRNADPAYTQASVLTRIQYPTGGSSEFFYQTNQYQKMVTEITYIHENAEIFKDDGSNVINYSQFLNPGGNFTVTTGSNRVGKKLQLVSLVSAPGSGTTVDLVLRKNGFVDKTISIIRSDGSGTPMLIDSTYVLEVGNYSLNYEVSSPNYLDVELRLGATILRVGQTEEQVERTFYAGGLRIKQVKDFDPISNKTNTRNYEYFNITQDGVPVYQSGLGFSATGCPINGSWIRSNHMYRYGHSVYNFMDASDAPYLGYEKVQVSEIAGDEINGMSEYNYSPSGGSGIINYLNSNYNTGISNPLMPTIPSIPSGYRGKLFEEIHKKHVDGSFTPVASKKYYYTVENGGRFWQMIFSQGQGDHVNSARLFHITGHQFAIPVLRNMLDRVENYSYDDLGNPTLSSFEEYEYDKSNGHYQLVKKTSGTSSREMRSVNYKFPDDYPGLENQTGLDLTAQGIKLLQMKHIIKPIETFEKIEGSTGSKYISGTVYNYDNVNPTLKSVMALETSVPLTTFNASSINGGNFLKNSLYKNRVNFKKYDGGRLLEQTLESGFSLSYIWSYKKLHVTAETKNASSDQIAFTSFEDAEAVSSENVQDGNWMFSPAFSNEGRTGKKCFNGATINKGGLSSGRYSVTLWVKGSGTTEVNGQSLGSPLRTINDWTLYQWVLSNPGSITINNSGNKIDDLRLSPVNAQMTTYTYDPLIGITSSTDANNVTTYYEYDSLGRLQTVKDSDENIVKHYKYMYRGDQ